MEIKIPYGRKEHITVTVPKHNLVGVFSSPGPAPLKDEHYAIAESLACPCERAPLNELAKNKKNAVIAVTDYSRPNIESKVLPYLVKELNDGGITDDKITVLIGPGSHRASYEEEIKEKLGSLYGRIQTVVHSAFKSETKDLGTTSFGHPVKINRQFFEADLKVVLGTLLPHPFAGFSGGGKMVSVGIASAETIASTHRPSILDHPQASFGIIEENPFYLSSLEMARMAGVDFLVNGIMDSEGRLCSIKCGDVEKAHFELVHSARKFFEVPVSEKADVLVVSSGYPKDSSLFHVAGMGICAAAGAAVKDPCVKKGGRLIIVSPMEDGIYNHTFYNTLAAYPSPKDVVDAVSQFREFEPGHHRAYGVAQVLEDYDVVIAQPKLEGEIFRKIHLKFEESTQKAINDGLKDYGNNARIAFLHYSHRMIVKYSPKE